MEGYTRPKPASRYVTLLQTLQESFVTAWPSAEVTFYKFGETVEPITSQKGFKAAAMPQFYHGPIARETRISLVFQKITPQALTLLVTDLFQSDADVAVMVQTLASQINKYHLSLAVVAVRSEFAGVVYDVGPQALHFRYRSSAGKTETYRPFYVLAIATEPILRRYLDQLRRDSTVISSTSGHILLLSPAAFHEAFTSHLTWLRPGPGLVATRSFIKCESKEGFGFQFSRPNGSVTLSADLPYVKIPDAPTLLPPKMAVQINALAWSDGQKTWQPLRSDNTIGVQIESAARQRPASSSPSPPAPSTLSGAQPDSAVHLTIALDSAQLNVPNSIYAFEIAWTAGPDAFQLPDWCQRWDMDMSHLGDWAKRPDTFDGSTTLHLKNFVQDLWTTMVENEAPETGRLYLLVRSN